VVTLYDVARRAGVSIATVSRVLHGQDPVRDSTRARVRAAIDELGYVPDGAAQSLARNRKEVIGLVCVEHTGLKPDQYDVESMSLLFYDEVMRGVEARIRERSWSLLITFLREDETKGTTLAQDEPVKTRMLKLSGKVDGLLIGEGVVAPSTIALLARRLPVVVVAGETAMRGADVVSADNWSGAHALVTHLIDEHGRRRLFHVDGPASAPDAMARKLAMESVIEAHPGTVLTGSFTGRFTVHSGGEAAEWLLADAEAAVGTPAATALTSVLPDAIICANDQMAIGVLRTLTAHGIRVPQDIAVVGFDDIFPASLCDPPLTTVHQAMRYIGERACDRLIERIGDPSLRPRVEVLPTELVLRSSCGCPPGTVARRQVTPVPRRQATPSKANSKRHVSPGSSSLSPGSALSAPQPALPPLTAGTPALSPGSSSLSPGSPLSPTQPALPPTLPGFLPTSER
jgi:LacI family transcriptional regulator